MDEIDIWHVAAAMIYKHGADAAIEAALCSDQLLNDGDGAVVWHRITKAINALDAGKPAGLAVH